MLNASYEDCEVNGLEMLRRWSVLRFAGIDLSSGTDVLWDSSGLSGRRNQVCARARKLCALKQQQDAKNRIN
jgi:hypothetical protein